MSCGILQGKYTPKFGKDSAAQMLLAITSYKEKQTKQAINQLNSALTNITQQPHSVLSVDSLRYALTYNLAAIERQQGNVRAAKQAWKKMAAKAKQNGNAYIFQLAVSNINQNAIPEASKSPTTKSAFGLGNKYKSNSKTQNISEVWFDGDRYQVVRTEAGLRLVLDERDYLIAASNVPTRTNGKTISIGDAADRPLVYFGLPARRIHLTSGEYLAYDSLALAIHIVNGRVAGWFSYRSPKP